MRARVLRSSDFDFTVLSVRCGVVEGERLRNFGPNGGHSYRCQVDNDTFAGHWEPARAWEVVSSAMFMLMRKSVCVCACVIFIFTFTPPWCCAALSDNNFQRPLFLCIIFQSVILSGPCFWM